MGLRRALEGRDELEGARDNRNELLIGFSPSDRQPDADEFLRQGSKHYTTRTTCQWLVCSPRWWP